MQVPLVSVSTHELDEPCQHVKIIIVDVDEMKNTPFYFHKKCLITNVAGKDMVTNLINTLLRLGVPKTTVIDFLTDRKPNIAGDNVVNINKKSNPRYRFVAVEFYYNGKFVRCVAGSTFYRYGVMKNGEWSYYRNFSTACLKA